MFFPPKNQKTSQPIATEDEAASAWLNYEEAETEGQLAIDVYETPRQIIVKSTIAGVKPEDLKISLHNDLLTIRGRRSSGEAIKSEDYLYQECYWGNFSRSIILPAEVASQSVEAELENGVLTITLYKTKPSQIAVKIKD